jgi:hypothetical protein
MPNMPVSSVPCGPRREEAEEKGKKDTQREEGEGQGKKDPRREEGEAKGQKEKMITLETTCFKIPSSCHGRSAFKSCILK